MLTDAAALAILSSSAFALTYWKLPARVRQWIKNHPLAVDIITAALTFMTLGTSLTGLAAGVMVGLLTSLMLHIANHKEDFMYLYDLADFMGAKLRELQKMLKEYGAQYRLSKEQSQLPARD